MPEVRVFRTIGREAELGKVMVSMKIFPSDIIYEMKGFQETVRKTLEGKATIYKFDEEPVAFGLEALVAHVGMPEDVEGRMDEVEQLLQSVKGGSEGQVRVARR